jgi:hypothetical protein
MVIAFLLVLLFSGAGCTANVVFVHALEPPGWQVAPSRTIGVVAVIAGETGRNVHLTRDLAAVLARSLSKSAYYTAAKKDEIEASSFAVGRSGERMASVERAASLGQKLSTELLLLVQVLDSYMHVDLGGHVGFGLGFGRYSHGSAFGAGFGTGSAYWNAHARMGVSVSLLRGTDGCTLAHTVEGHSFHRTYADLMPSESAVFAELLIRACARTLTCVDVHYRRVPRRLIHDGSRLVADGIRYAMLGGGQNRQTARHLWTRALAAAPGSLAANYNLGVASELNEEFDAALSYYRAARDAVGRDDAFAREMEEASRSAAVLARFGSPAPEQPQPPEAQGQPGEAPPEQPAPAAR